MNQNFSIVNLTINFVTLYCTPLRQNGLVESILSKMRIHINEKTTMDF